MSLRSAWRRLVYKMDHWRRRNGLGLPAFAWPPLFRQGLSWYGGLGDLQAAALHGGILLFTLSTSMYVLGATALMSPTEATPTPLLSLAPLEEVPPGEPTAIILPTLAPAGRPLPTLPPQPPLPPAVIPVRIPPTPIPEPTDTPEPTSTVALSPTAPPLLVSGTATVTVRTTQGTASPIATTQPTATGSGPSTATPGTTPTGAAPTAPITESPTQPAVNTSTPGPTQVRTPTGTLPPG